MLKLLKHEIIRLYRKSSHMILATILGFVIIFFLPFSLSEVNMVQAQRVVRITVSGIVGGFVFGMFGSIVSDFVGSMYLKPGYLTLTLPISTEKIVLTKIMGALIWSMLEIIVLLLLMIYVLNSWAGTGISVTMYEVVGDILFVITNYYLEIFGAVITLLSTLSFIISAAYLLVTLVNTKYIPKYKGLFLLIISSVIIYVIYFIMSRTLVQNLYMQLDVIGVFVFVNSVLLAGIGLSFFSTVYLIKNKIDLE